MMGYHKLLQMRRMLKHKAMYDIYNAKGECVMPDVRNPIDTLARYNRLWKMGLIFDGPFRIYRY